MCEWGTDEKVRVKIAAHLSYNGKERWKNVGIDACIAPLVRALQEGGVDMLGSCCGHGKAPGRIDLADGRVLIVADAAKVDSLKQQDFELVMDALHSPPGPDEMLVRVNDGDIVDADMLESVEYSLAHVRGHVLSLFQFKREK